MKQHTLPELKIGKQQQPPRHSIHTLPPQKNKAFDQVKYPLVHQQSPLHQLIRVSLTNKTLVYKKRLGSQEKRLGQNPSPSLYHQSQKVVVAKQTPRMVSEPSSEIRGNKSPIHLKPREKKAFFDEFKKTPKRDSQNQRVSMDSIILTKPKKVVEQFQICPWQNQDFRVLNRVDTNHPSRFPSLLRQRQ